jgi:pimeloyl-ACP methyl ester carboxylesterase
LPEGVDAAIQVMQIARDKYSKVSKVVTWGSSLGGLTAQALAEQYPGAVDAVAPLCIADSAQAEITMAGDFLWGMKTFFNPAIKGSGYSAADVDDLLALVDETMPSIKSEEDKHYEGIAIKPTLTERADRYAERTVRLLMAEYPNHEYVWLVEQLTALRTKYNVDSNAETIIKMIEEVTGQQAPTL